MVLLDAASIAVHPLVVKYMEIVNGHNKERKGR
jgi:hypothetical protein